jgi:hypothetical protein
VSNPPQTFPFDLFGQRVFPGTIGRLVEAVRPFSMFPPYPWGQWLYGRAFERLCTGLDGDVLEAGVGRGGMSFFFGLLVRHLGLEKTVVAVDSFEGLPEPTASDNAYFSGGEYGPATPDDDLLRTFWLNGAQLGLADAIVPVRGYFEDVLPELEPDRSFCFVHVDADLHGSVLTALESLYDRIVDGGILVVDDFFHPVQGPHRAVAEFFNARGLVPLLHVAFPYSVAIVKGEDTALPKRSVDGNAYSLDWLREDDFFLACVESSLAAAADVPRSRGNCELLWKTLTSRTPDVADIYDYWRALEEFWEWVDVMPGERVPHKL